MQDYTNILTVFWSLIFIAVPFIYIIAPSAQNKTVEILSEPFVRWIVAAVLFLIAMFHIMNHNLWTSGMELFVTMLGWIVLVKSVFLAFFPDMTELSLRIMNSKVFPFIMLAYIVVGLYLLNSVFVFKSL